MIEIAGMLKGLSDETRLRIMNLLYDRELCVCDVMETLRITQAKASRHLIYLKNAGVVTDRKQAQWVYYSRRQGNHLKFIDVLVNENLRKDPVYKKDLENLREWLARKNIPCE